MKKIEISGGQFALVDDEDFEKISSFKWYVMPYPNTLYAARADYSGEKKRTIRMHREIMNVAENFVVDHVDGNGLNNQKSNLRVTDRIGNVGNRKKETRRITTSRFKGVSWNRQKCKWVAQLECVGYPKAIGFFDCEEDAARAYDQRAIIKFGAFAKTNFSLHGVA